jgi:general secretion pathway protein B
MSLILDALKKAESERNLGAVPHLHVHAMPALAPAPKNAAVIAASSWIMVALATAVVALWWWRHPSPAATASPVPAPTSAGPAPGLATTPLKVIPATRPPLPKVASAPLPAVVPAKDPLPAAATADQGVAKMAAANSPAADMVPTLQELPASVQQSLPALTIGGYIYAERPADRSVIINQKLLREGDQVVPGLILEKMTPKEMQLNYRGQRYRAPY